jgi:hypothetical protein
LAAAGSDSEIYIDINPKGSGGRIRLCRQATDWIEALGGSGSVALSAIGGTAAIDLILSPKGTGVVDLNYASIALGAGGAATLGLTGGSGPATTTQNAWLKVEIAGTASYIPFWR